MQDDMPHHASTATASNWQAIADDLRAVADYCDGKAEQTARQYYEDREALKTEARDNFNRAYIATKDCKK
jgi:hypothetical protein